MCDFLLAISTNLLTLCWRVHRTELNWTDDDDDDDDDDDRDGVEEVNGKRHCWTVAAHLPAAGRRTMVDRSAEAGQQRELQPRVDQLQERSETIARNNKTKRIRT